MEIKQLQTCQVKEKQSCTPKDGEAKAAMVQAGLSSAGHKPTMAEPSTQSRAVMETCPSNNPVSIRQGKKPGPGKVNTYSGSNSEHTLPNCSPGRNSGPQAERR